MKYIVNTNTSRNGHSKKIKNMLECFIHFLKEVINGYPITLNSFKLHCPKYDDDDDDDDDEPLMKYDKDISNFTNEGFSDDGNFLDGEPLHIINTEETTIGGTRQKQRKKENRRKLKRTRKNK